MVASEIVVANHLITLKGISATRNKAQMWLLENTCFNYDKANNFLKTYFE